jgi:hypothetical protein
MRSNSLVEVVPFLHRIWLTIIFPIAFVTNENIPLCFVCNPLAIIATLKCDLAKCLSTIRKYVSIHRINLLMDKMQILIVCHCKNMAMNWGHLSIPIFFGFAIPILRSDERTEAASSNIIFEAF